MPMAAPSPAEPVLFEAVTTPACSCGRDGLRLVTLLLVLPAIGLAALSATVGAWPVIGFLAVALALALALLALHRRRSARQVEIVTLTADRLTVMRIDGDGRPAVEATLEPYWSRVWLHERAGAACELWLTQPRHRAIEIGCYLGDAERRELATALGAALRRYREPVFDNPQLREEGAIC
jgi:uncharacterized membrane protein